MRLPVTSIALPLLLVLAGLAPARADPFALVSAAEAGALMRAPAGSPRAQAIRFADRVLDRTPHAMNRIHVEGTLPHQGIYDESREALRDFPAARDLALAARLTGEARYAEAASRLIAAWLDRYRPSFNPIDETGFDALILAYDLLPPSYRAPIATPMLGFMRALSRGYLDRIATVTGTIATNNWQSHRVKLAVLSAFESGEADTIERAQRAFAAQLGANLRPDGSTYDFELRDAIHYVVYDLEPLVLAALAAARHGTDWYAAASPNEASLAKSLDWLAPYADGSRTHAEFVHSTVRFDYQRREAGVTGFSGDFDPKAARDLFAAAARLDRRYADLSHKLGTTGPWLDLVWPLAR